jgi:hypothetical protein
MNKKYFFSIVLLFVFGISFSQTKKPATVPKISAFESKIKATNLPYEKINDSTVVIPFKGTEVASYQIIIVKTANMYVLLSNISNSITGVENAKKYKRLLELNNDLDIVKFSIEKGTGKIFARIDAYDTSINAKILGSLISQIADAVDFAAKEFK